MVHSVNILNLELGVDLLDLELVCDLFAVARNLLPTESDAFESVGDVANLSVELLVI